MLVSMVYDRHLLGIHLVTLTLHTKYRARWLHVKAQCCSLIVHKGKGKGNPGDWYATMPVQVWIDLLRKALDK